jgi:opacity protein-like surface antigen
MKIAPNKCLLTLTCLLLSSSVLAYSSSKKPTHTNYKGEVPFTLEDPNHFEVIAGLGISAIDADDSYLAITSNETDKLVQTNNHRWNTLVGQLGAGYVFFFPNKLRFSPETQWFTSLEPELNFYYAANQVKGDIYRFSDPNFNDFTYKTTITTSRLMLDAALTIVARSAYSLFVIGGIGNSWSTVGYHDTQDAGASCSVSALSNHDKHRSHFAWELGAGVAYAFNDKVNLSLEYLYTDFGTMDLSGTLQNTALTTTQTAQSSFNLNTQAVLLDLHVALS